MSPGAAGRGRPGIGARLLARPPGTALGLAWPIRALPPAPPPAWLDGATTFSLASSNALLSNRRPDDWAAAVLALDADVLAVQELAPHLAEALDRAGVAERYPASHVHPERGSGGCALFTRLPLLGAELTDAGYPAVLARVALGGQPLTLLTVHTIAPSAPGKGPGWKASFDAVAAIAAAAGPRFLAVGDWNATMAHWPLPDVLARAGLRDAHTELGRGEARSWPSGATGTWWDRLPPLGLLDRVLLGPDVAATSVGEVTLPGSDHRGLLVGLAARG